MNPPLADALREQPSRCVMVAGAVVAALVLFGACTLVAPRGSPVLIATPVELELAVRAPTPEVAVPPVDTDPERVVGLDAAGISALLGSPGAVRREGPAQVWQYSRKNCIVDLYLYTDATGGPLSVVYYEVREGRRGTTIEIATARRDCFAGLLERSGTV